ncbi:MAG: ribosome-associated translation inhibitor RaiA [Alphaproteobacteria bacterium]|nr:ribosome-associated translation inhibitor RaiA [Alphaproteobacteria bacterium]
MKIMTSGKHIEVGEALKTHIETSLKNIVQRQLGDVLEAQVVVSKDNYQFSTDISIHVSKHFTVRAHAQDTDPYRSCDLALERMEARIHRYKTRLRDKKRSHDDDFFPAQQYVINTHEEDKGEDTPLIIAEMQHEIPTLSVGEAVMRMDLSDSTVMMFKNSNSGHFNVVYRRNDGHIGWIDPSIVKE